MEKELSEESRDEAIVVAMDMGLPRDEAEVIVDDYIGYY